MDSSAAPTDSYGLQGLLNGLRTGRRCQAQEVADRRHAVGALNLIGINAHNAVKGDE